MSKLRTTRRPGYSLIEVSICTLLVGTVVLGALAMHGAAVQTYIATVDSIDGPLLADSLMEEIVALPYIDPDGSSAARGVNSDELSGDRSTFDDVDDYNGYTETPPRDRNNATLSGYTGVTRTVTVDHASWLTGAITNGTDTKLKLIHVQVSSDDGRVTDRYAYRAADGMLEQAPTVDTVVVTNLKTSITLGSGATTWHESSLVNHAEDPNSD